MQGDDFIGRIGHELRTPLNAILGFSSLLQREANLTPRQVERLCTIESSGRTLLARIDTLLASTDIVPRGQGQADGPADPADAAMQAPAAASPREFADDADTILVIDDTPANVDLLAELLQERGMRVIAAANAAQGLAAARGHAPDLILLDVKLPDAGGFDVCRQLKADPATAAIPVIFMTAVTDTASKVAAFEAGAADYITKPFHVDEAVARVNMQLKLLHGQRTLAHMNEELEARVADRTAQLEAANRELQALCYSMAHDLRGPLGTLDGFSRLLGESLADAQDERTRRYIDRIRSGVRQMDGLTDALLMLAHLTLHEHHEEEVDLAALASRVLRKYTDAEPGRQVQLHLQPGMVVQGDRALMTLLVQHLIDNAWKFTAEAAPARIEFGTLAAQANTQGQAGLVYFVRDNGVGFDMTYADKLFKPFQRLHGAAEFPGLGIGLAVVERIVHRRGGRAWAEAAPGGGATFYFTLERT